MRSLALTWACRLTLTVLAGSAPAFARQVDLPSLLNLHSEIAPVRYSPGALDRAAHVQARLEVLAADFSRWGTQRYTLQGLVLAPEDWAAGGLRRPYGLPERTGAHGLATPAWGDDRSVALWKRLYGGALPWGSEMPVRGTSEEAASLALADVILQVEAARIFVEGERLGGSEPWIGELVAHAVALQAFSSHEAERLPDLAEFWARVAGNRPGFAACAARHQAAGALACDARFAAGAQILIAEDRLKTVRKIEKIARKRGLTAASLVKEYPALASWVEDGSR